MAATRAQDSRSADDVRKAAIDHHHDQVGVFESHYVQMERDRFANAFAYGRHKVDLVLDRELSALPRGATVLDAGCGTGVYLQRFARLGLVPVGLEPAEGMIAAARRDNPGVRIEHGVITDLPFADASFDAVTAIEVLRYLHRADIQTAYAELLRVLKPGGLLFVTLVNRFALDGFYLLQRLRQRSRGVDFDRKNPHCEFYTPAEAEAELRAAGAVEVRTVGRLLAPLRFAYKANERLGGRLAARLERLDDGLHERFPAVRGFAGHLIAIARKPGHLPAR